LRIAPFIFTPTATTATATLTLTQPYARSNPSQVNASWGWRQAGQAGSLGGSASVTIRQLGTSTPIFQRPATQATGSWKFAGVPGSTYVMSVSNRDLAGQRSATTSTEVVVPRDDRSFRFLGTWTRTRRPGDIAGSDASTTATNASAAVTAKGRSYAVRVRTGPNEGVLAVSGGSHVLGRYDLYSPAPSHRRITIFGSAHAALASRTFTFSPTGQKQSRSKAAAVNVDGLYVSR
jgi:hypothetical protein